MENTARELIKRLELAPHPEGGYFRETYRAPQGFDPQHLPNSHYPGYRDFYTAIYYLLEGQDKSRFHRITSDEIIHHYYGSDITVHMLHEDNGYWANSIGPESGHFHIRVPANHWFAMTVNDPNRYSLLGCTVAPGFHFDDFKMAEREKLIAQFPDQKALIESLT